MEVIVIALLMLKATLVRNHKLQLAFLLCVATPSTFAGVITSTYSAENPKFEVGSSTATVWTSGFDLVAFLSPVVSVTPLLSEEFAAAAATVDRGMRFISEVKTELISRILDEGLGK